MTVDNAELAVDGKRILMSLHIVCIYKPDQYPTCYWLIYGCLHTIIMHSAMVDNHQYQLNVWSYSVWSVINFLLGSLLPTLNLCDMISNLTFSLCEDIINYAVHVASTSKLINLYYILPVFLLLPALSPQSHCHYCHYYHDCHHCRHGHCCLLSQWCRNCSSCSGFSRYTFQPVNLCS